jgi:hypothetical protein
MNLIPRKPVSQIKFPSLPLPKNKSRHAVKKISVTNIAATMDLGTENGQTELLTLSMHHRYEIGDSAAPTTSLLGSKIASGLEVSPNKSSGGTSGFRRKYIRRVTSFTSAGTRIQCLDCQYIIRGGFADKACMLLSRFQTAETLWSRQMQLSNNNIKPDMRLQIVDVPQSASPRAVPVKCIDLTDNRQISVLLLPNAGSDGDLQVRQNQRVHVWRPWTIVGGVVLCKRFVIIS